MSIGKGFLFAIVGLTVLGACSDSDQGTAPEQPRKVPASVVIHAGNFQAATVGTPVPVPPAVQVHDAYKTPLPDIPVYFTVVAGGGSITAGEQVTNADGIATFPRWVLGTKAGSNRLQATVVDLQPVTFFATGTPGAPRSVEIIQGNQQRAHAGSTLPQNLIVRVRDRYDNPVPNVEVKWTITAGGGSVSPVAPKTDEYGDGKARWTLGTTPGPNELRVDVEGVEPVTFTAVGTYPPLTIVSGNHQTGVMLSTLPEPLVVRVVNEEGEPQAGVPVEFAVDSSPKAAVQFPHPSTNADGIATAGQWRLGLAPGIQTVRAYIAGVAYVEFEATATGTIEWFSGVDIAMGADHYCGLVEGGTAYCWGANSNGSLGNGTSDPSPAPMPVQGGIEFRLISAGSAHTCGLTESGEAYCWGANHYGQLGDSTQISSGVPVPVKGGHRFRTISAGADFTCGITVDSVAYCWGANLAGQLGDSTRVSKSVPTPVAADIEFKEIEATKSRSAGANGWTCGLDQSGTAYCWGENTWGQLGDGTLTSRLTPTAVQGGFKFKSISVGAAVCGVAEDGAAYCWGQNNNGQIGDGTTINRLTPTRVSGNMRFLSVRTNETHTCGLTESQVAYCWGYNVFGQLGTNGSPGSYYQPVPVFGGLQFKKLDVGRISTCAIALDNAVYCWGPNSGEEGLDYSDRAHFVPVRVFWRVVP